MALIALFSSGRTGQPSETFATRKNSGAALERIISAGARIVAGGTEPTYRLLRSGDRLRNAICETRYIAVETEAD